MRRQGLAGFLRRHAIGLLALFVALGGTSYAVTANKFTSSDGTIAACANKRSGSVRLVVAGKRCRKGEQRVTWNQRGLAGTNGTPGPAGSIQGAAAGGDLTGTYPDPAIAAPPAPVAVADNPNTASDPCFPGAGVPPATMVFCGTSSARWTSGPVNTPGVHVSVDRFGQVHVRGLTELSSGTIGTGVPLFVLPAGQRPSHFLDFPTLTEPALGVTPHAAMLQVEPEGYVGVYTSTPGDKQVVIGDVSFRPGD